jgi:5-methylcytosine-specific restriction protein B
MNTADRSIAVLDTALRRRFLFKELEPNSDIIVKASENPIIEGKNALALLLNSINSKIEKLYDRDHRIGHSYFLDAVNVKTLRQVWYYQIIPLMLEYFYNDSDKVSKIVGKSFFNKETHRVNFDLSNEDFITAIQNIYSNE